MAVAAGAKHMKGKCRWLCGRQIRAEEVAAAVAVATVEQLLLLIGLPKLKVDAGRTVD